MYNRNGKWRLSESYLLNACRIYVDIYCSVPLVNMACCTGKSAVAAVTPTTSPEAAPVSAAAPKPKIYVIYYSLVLWFRLARSKWGFCKLMPTSLRGSFRVLQCAADSPVLQKSHDVLRPDLLW